jgi:hypothetical protein
MVRKESTYGTGTLLRVWICNFARFGILEKSLRIRIRPSCKTNPELSVRFRFGINSMHTVLYQLKVYPELELPTKLKCLF